MRDQNFEFLFETRVVGDELEHKAVELRFREAVRSFGFDRVLRRDREERTREGARRSVDRRGAFLRRFEERGVRLGGGAVNFVGEKDLRKNRAGTEGKFLRFRVENERADDVGRRQVRRELNASETTAERATKRLREKGFAETRDAFDENVSAGKKSDERSDDEFALPDERFFNFDDEAAVNVGEAARRGVVERRALRRRFDGGDAERRGFEERGGTRRDGVGRESVGVERKAHRLSAEEGKRETGDADFGRKHKRRWAAGGVWRKKRALARERRENFPVLTLLRRKN